MLLIYKCEQQKHISAYRLGCTAVTDCNPEDFGFPKIVPFVSDVFCGSVFDQLRLKPTILVQLVYGTLVYTSRQRVANNKDVDYTVRMRKQACVLLISLA